MRIAVLSDTHAPRFWKQCPPAVAAQLTGIDLILHAGDVCTPEVLEELSGYGQTLAVLGNNDGADVADWGAPETRQFAVEDMNVAMIHDGGPAKGRLARLRRRFPDAGLIVFGHSHIPWNEEADGVRIFNPGSPTDRRRQPCGTMGLLEIRRGAVSRAEIIEVTDPR